MTEFELLAYHIMAAMSFQNRTSFHALSAVIKVSKKNYVRTGPFATYDLSMH